MKLYEIDNAILECIDFETGEIVDAEKLNELQIQREEKIESVALWYKNVLADAEAIKAEKNVLAEREAKARAKAESIKKWLEFALNGEKMSTPKVEVNFRKSESVEVDEVEFVKWALAEADDLLSFKDPTPNKTAIKAAIKNGRTIEGATLISKTNISIK